MNLTPFSSAKGIFIPLIFSSSDIVPPRLLVRSDSAYRMDGAGKSGNDVGSNGCRDTAAVIVENSMGQFPPPRLRCLPRETVETLYLLGEQDRIVGVSGYAVRPPQVRREKPRVSAFISADIPKILALKPDLVLAFSDLQANIVADLVRAGVAIHVFNQRD